MSAAAAQPVVDVPSPPKRRLSKKLIVILAAVAVLLLGGGAATVYLLKKRAADAAAAAEGEGGEDAGEAAHAAPAKKERHGPPTFLPMDTFVVNLADREDERYAQVGVTLQVDDPKAAEELKLYMPAIRNGVLMILAHKTSAELLEREGKERLAAEIMREAVRPLGIELPAVAASGAAVQRKKSAEPEVHNPVEAVQFSSFIIQ
ncbi:MAG TPA: flagellar basal body-associated FliL family protein [Methylibium sp.]|nr:flagellar basal body-associated FliL family protein [Methylibium sp.]